MNEQLKQSHLDLLSADPNAAELYERVCAQALLNNGGISDAAQQLAYMIADQEILANKYREDIRKHGVREKWYNGRQSGERENKSCAALRSCCDTQRKLMAELKITPASGGFSGNSGGGLGGFEEF